MTGDWFDRAAPMVLALEDDDLSALAVPVARVEKTPEEAVLGALAFLEFERRRALAEPDRLGGDYLHLLAFYEDEVDRPHARSTRGHGFGERIARLVRARPQPPVIPSALPT